MRCRAIVAAGLLISMAALGLSVATARADGNLNTVNHVIIVMQENHSFDNYFGALPYARAVRTIQAPVRATITPASTD